MKITPGLAEAIGIYVGDGYLRYHKQKELDISGGYDEKEYYDNHVIPLFNRIFNLNIKGRFFPSRRTYGFVIRDRRVINFFKGLGFPSGSKSTTIFVPDMIIKSKEPAIITSFLRGYFDTDGCINFRNRKGGKSYSDFKQKFHYYPKIFLTSVSENLIIDITKLLGLIGFKFYLSLNNPKVKNWNIAYRVILCGNTNTSKWIQLIGSKNPTKLSRFQIWSQFGFCPTNTTYNQRINILGGKLDPYSLYDGPVM